MFTLPRTCKRGILLVLFLALGKVGCSATSSAPAGSEVGWEPGRTLAPGVTYRSDWRPEGPWAIHRLEILPEACGIEVRTAKADDRIIGLERTSDLSARGALNGRSVLAAVNADFFRFDPIGVPEGPQVAEGVVVAGRASFGPPVAQRFDVPQPVFGVAEETGWFVGEVDLQGTIWVPGEAPLPLGRVNAPPAPDSVALFNRYAGPSIPLPDPAPVDPALGVPALGDSSLHATAELMELSTAPGSPEGGVVIAVDPAAAEVRVSPGHLSLAGDGAAADWIRTLAPGDTVLWTLDFGGAPGEVLEIVGGFPLLLIEGAPVLDRVPRINEGFAFGPHPRTAIGIREDGALLLVTVDGRQPGYSEGMTLPELTELLLGMGVRDALNLDGGGSTAFVLEGELVNRPSDADGERAVANALLVLGPPPGACPP